MIECWLDIMLTRLFFTVTIKERSLLSYLFFRLVSVLIYCKIFKWFNKGHIHTLKLERETERKKGFESAFYYCCSLKYRFDNAISIIFSTFFCSPRGYCCCCNSVLWILSKFSSFFFPCLDGLARHQSLLHLQIDSRPPNTEHWANTHIHLYLIPFRLPLGNRNVVAMRLLIFNI